jgi:hypothetical protein
VLSGRDLPQFLDAEAVGLRIDAFAQIEAGFELLAEVPAAAFGKQRVFGAQLHAGLEVGPLACRP